jgi:hypothetical protein
MISGILDAVILCNSWLRWPPLSLRFSVVFPGSKLRHPTTSSGDVLGQWSGPKAGKPRSLHRNEKTALYIHMFG